MERTVKQAFLRFVETVKSEPVLKEVVDFLTQGNVDGALSVVDRYVARMAPVVSQVFTVAASAEVPALAEQVQSWAPTVGLSFDPTNERAAALMRNAQLRFVREVSDSQRQSIRQALTNGLLDGDGPREVARTIRNAIGLTAKQEDAVRNYRRLLENGSAEALDRSLRDRRHDRSVERADHTGEPLSPDTIDKMVDRYRSNFVAYRAETIARTETARVVNEARDEALNQTVEEVGIETSLIERVWRSTMDNRVRDTHRAMDGQVVGKDQPFTSPSGASLMYPGDANAPAAEIVNCRCIALTRIKKRNAL